MMMRCDAAVRGHQDLALGQVEVQWLAILAAGNQAAVGGPERLQDGLQQRHTLFGWLAVDGGLRFLVGKFGGRPHHRALEGMAAFVAIAGRTPW